MAPDSDNSKVSGNRCQLNGSAQGLSPKVIACITTRKTLTTTDEGTGDQHPLMNLSNYF